MQLNVISPLSGNDQNSKESILSPPAGEEVIRENEVGAHLNMIQPIDNPPNT